MKFFGCFAICLCFLNSIRADETSVSSDLNPGDPFSAGQREFSVGGAVFFSPFIATKARPTINYAGALVQLGYMLNDPPETGPLRGNFEILGEGSALGIFTGDGNYIASTTLWLRYNIVPSQWKIVPYLQAGAGVSFTDIDRKIVGQTFNFNLDAAAGLRYFVKPDCSLNAEYRFQHISNADMAEHNIGINAQAAVLSVSWFF
jgi:hypothetical protein